MNSNNPFRNMVEAKSVDNTGHEEVSATDIRPDYADPNHPHGGDIEAQESHSSSNWTKKKKIWAALGGVFLLVLGSAVLIGSRFAHKKTETIPVSQPVSQPIEWHTVTISTTPNVGVPLIAKPTALASPVPDDNGGRPAPSVTSKAP